MIRAVIFDLDETLVNNLKNHIKASTEVFKPFQKGTTLITEEDPKYQGMRVSDAVRDMMRKLHIPDSRFDELYRKRQQIFLSLVKRSCKPMAGIAYITTLVDALHLKKALASSGMKKYIELALRGIKLTGYFDAIVSGEELSRGKPDPETFLVAARKLGLHPSDCIVIEDAKVGVVAAKRAGMKCIGVHYPSTWDKALAQDLSRADIEVRSLKAITEKMLMGT